MKITISDESIAVDGWLRNKFRASAEEVTEVRVMADNAVPKGLWNRLKLGLGRTQPEIKARAIMLWAGDKTITLDVYHDDQFARAVDWLTRHGWDIESATLGAIKTPLVRVTARKRRG
jgi:hypothetical protein